MLINIYFEDRKDVDKYINFIRDKVSIECIALDPILCRVYFKDDAHLICDSSKIGYEYDDYGNEEAFIELQGYFPEHQEYGGIKVTQRWEISSYSH